MNFGFNWQIFVGTIHRSEKTVVKANIFGIHGYALHIIKLEIGLNLYKNILNNNIYCFQ